MIPETGRQMTCSRTRMGARRGVVWGRKSRRAWSLFAQRFPGPKDSPPIGTSDWSNPLMENVSRASSVAHNGPPRCLR